MVEALAAAWAPTEQGCLRHEAVFHHGQDELICVSVAFIRAGQRAGEPVLVALGSPLNEAVRACLNGDVAGVCFAHDGLTGSNPARWIPAWQRFVDDHADATRVRGIGAPIGASRTADELAECHRHEALLNGAFDSAALWLLCPYDLAALDAELLAEARRTHPLLRRDGWTQRSPSFPGVPALVEETPPLEAAPGAATSLDFDLEGLAPLRRFVCEFATGAGLCPERTSDLVTAASELGANSVRHGGGRGTVRMWTTARSVVCEVRDRGHIDDPWAGRRRPPTGCVGGRGLWLANQLCDLVQIRSDEDGTVIRLHMCLEGPA